MAATARSFLSPTEVMSIGYNHAVRLIDLLEERGVIGPQVGAQPREILRP
jgi:DNA segregation ATPase FtsK/SpoIIIE-like protein